MITSPRFRRLFARLIEDRSGNFVMIFGLLLVPLVGLMGLSVDYALMNKLKVELDATNDAAVLAAATAASQTIQSEPSGTLESTIVSDATAAAQAAYLSFFASDSARTGALGLNYTTTNGGTNPLITINGLIINVSGIYTAQSNNVFGKLFNVPSSSVAGIAVSSVTLPKYINIYIVADVSMSEGLGTSNADMAALQTLTPNREDAPAAGCQFGCHVVSYGYTDSTNFEDLAHNYTGSLSTNTNNGKVNARGLTLRIDSMRNAVMDIVAQASQSSSASIGTPRVKLAVYTMDLKVTTVAALTSNFSQLMTTVEPPGFPNNPVTSLGPIDLSSSTSYVYPYESSGNNEDGMSYQASLLSGTNGVSSLISANGDGSTPNTPQNYVFLMTDGVYDINSASSTSGPNNGACQAWQWNHCTGAISSADCTKFAGKATVDIIYTQYLQDFGENRYQTLVQPFQNPNQTVNANGVPTVDNVQTGLNNCAAAGDPGGQVYLATSGGDIESAATSLFNQVVLAERLTE